MIAPGLHVVHGPGGRVIPLTPRASSGIGDGAITLGLVRMMRRAGTELRLPVGDLDVLEVALAADATTEARRGGAKRLAEHYRDWSATEQGRSELRRLWTYLAPHSPYPVLGKIAQELVYANDLRFGRHDRDLAVDNADQLLDEAVTKPALQRISRPAWWHHGPDDGPGAA